MLVVVATGCSDAGSGPTTRAASSSSRGSESEGCGSSCAQAGPVGTPPPTQTNAAANPVGDYLGCHEYCAQAGAAGGGVLPSTDPNITIVYDQLRLVAGRLPVTIACTRSVACQGAILVSAANPDLVDLGRSDLQVPAHSQRVIAVQVPAAGLQTLASSGGLPGSIVVFYDDPSCPGDIHRCALAHRVSISAS